MTIETVTQTTAVAAVNVAEREQPRHIATQTIRTTCAYCGVGCGIIAEVNPQTREVAVKGDPEHPANYGRLCSKGSALGETLSLTERLAEPRLCGETVSWDTALDAVATRLADTVREHGPDSVMFYVSGQLLTEDYYAVNKFAKGFIGTNNIDSNSRLCMSSAVAGYKRAFGSDTVPTCYEDIEKAELFVICGSNMAWCHPVLFQRLKAAQEKDGKRVVVIDPRATDSCAIAQLHLPIKPGTDTILFNGLLAYLDANGYADANYLAHCEGQDEALDLARWYHDIAQVAEACDVTVEAVETFYQWFAETEKTVTFYSMGVNQSSAGTDKVNSIINCHALTGRIGREGMGPFSITGQPNAMGGREVGALSNLLAAHYDLTNDAHREEVQSFWQAPQVISGDTGVTAPEAAAAIKSGKVKAIWVMATNPVVSITEANAMAEALAMCETVIVSDCSEQSDTLAYATIALPAQGWSEKSGTVTNSERRISRQRRLLEPHASARPDWWIVSQVAQRMGFDGFDYASEYDVFMEHVALSAYRNGDDAAHKRSFNLSGLMQLSAQDYDDFMPIQWPLKEQGQTQKRFFSQDLVSVGQTYTPSNKVRLIPIKPSLPKGKLSKRHPLVLNTGRIRDQWHTMTRTALSPRLNQHLPEPFVLMHPDDALKYAVTESSLVRIHNDLGDIVVSVKISDGQRRGELFCPMHWNGNFAQNARVGQLIYKHVDPISGQPEFKYTPVSLEPVTVDWRALVITAHDVSLDDAVWPRLSDWVCNKQATTHEHLFAGQADALSEVVSAVRDSALSESAQLLHYHDAARDVTRLAVIDGGALRMVAFFERNKADLPNTTWLKSCFDLDFNDTEATHLTRKWLLAGQPAEGDFDVGRIVCSCFTVGEKTILKAIQEQGCKTAADVGKCLKAGTNCGSCVPEIKELIGSS